VRKKVFEKRKPYAGQLGTETVFHVVMQRKHPREEGKSMRTERNS
jgi:hypothetical protein